jgi:hypothetical protein
MSAFRKSLAIVLLILSAFEFEVLSAAESPAKISFVVTIDSGLLKKPVGGRLLIFMTDRPQFTPFIEPFFPDLSSVWVCAKEIDQLAPGKSIEVDPDALAFPRPFSEAKPGNYQIMALLDVNHDYAYALLGPGHLLGPVVSRENVHPDEAGVINLRLSKQSPDSPVSDSAARKLVKMNSVLLSRFRGKPVEMQAGVILPPSYAKSPAHRFPTVYVVHGYSSSHLTAWTNRDANWGTDVEAMVSEMNAGKWPEMIYVFLDARCPLGHCVFADSANNGPCGRALTEEFLP